MSDQEAVPITVSDERLIHAEALKWKKLAVFVTLISALITGAATYYGNIRRRDEPVKPSISQRENTELAAYVFGNRLGTITYAFTSHEAANRKNSDLLKSATDSIRTVTIHGGSWINNLEVQRNFEKALERTKIEMLVVDPLGEAFVALSESKKQGLEKEFGFGNERLSKDTFKRYYDYYKDVFIKYRDKSSIKYYSAFPWIRFTIYDNTNATLVLTPFLKPGTESTIFYTEDPWLIGCLNRIYRDFESHSRTIETIRDYEELWK